MKNKQLARVNPGVVQAKIDSGRPLTLAELAVHTGYGYSTVRGWDWLPMLDGKVFYDDFVIARRRVTGLEAVPRSVARRSASNAGKCG